MSDTSLQETSLFMAAQKTGNGVIVKLYSPNPQVIHAVVKLYDTSLDIPTEELLQLPLHLLKDIQSKGIDTDTVSDMKKEQAQAKGLVYPVEPNLDFHVKMNGEKTTKRVDWKVTLAAWDSASSPAAGEAGEQAVYKEIDRAGKNLLTSIAKEVSTVGATAYLSTINILNAGEEIGETIDGLDVNTIYKLAFDEVSKKFDSARGAWVLPLKSATANDFNNIKEGTIETLADDLAEGHWFISDADAARDLINNLGIKIVAEHVDDASKRVEVAQSVWLYADLVTKYDKSPTVAKEMIDDYFTEVPF